MTKASTARRSAGRQHFAGLMFAEATGIELEIIAYPGGRAVGGRTSSGGHIPCRDHALGGGGGGGR